MKAELVDEETKEVWNSAREIFEVEETSFSKEFGNMVTLPKPDEGNGNFSSTKKKKEALNEEVI